MIDNHKAFVTTGENRAAQVVVICDHASNLVPDFLGGCLGLPAEDMARHIAYDVGAEGVSLELGRLMDAPVVCSRFSRLVIDPNRGQDDPTLVMKLYDGTIIPANRHLDADGLHQRLQACYLPYHTEVARLLDARENPVIISVHSFTPQLRGRHPRPWHVGILSAADRRLSDALLTELTALDDICVGDNEPYNGALQGDTMERHALDHGRDHTLIELRNDLIDTPEGQRDWANRLAPCLHRAISSLD